MDGVLIIDKPEDWTSHDVVARCRRILRTKKIGHTGTLDPFATGVLVILVGKATRLARFLDKDKKEYEAVIQFGFETDTGDKTGERKSDFESRQSDIEEKLAEIDWKEVLSLFRGEVVQTPPMYSAKKIKGKKLYELAREGVEIEREPVKVEISKLEIIENQKQDAENRISIRVACSAGTYIRTLAEDIGKKIEIGAHLAELRRVRAGKFSLEKAVNLETLAEMAENDGIKEILISPNDGVSHLPKIVLSDEETKKTFNGMKLFRREFAASDGQAVRMSNEKNELVAVGFYSEADGFIQPRVVVI